MISGRGFASAGVAVDPAPLREALVRLEAICPEYRKSTDRCRCAGSKSASHMELTELLGDLMAFLVDRFRQEEEAMKRLLLPVLDPEGCAGHIEDHADFSHAIGQVIVRLDNSPLHDLLRDIEHIVGRWLDEHRHGHDRCLDAWLERLATVPPAGRAA